MKLSRAPRPSLRPFVDVIWASDGETSPVPQIGWKELVLPTGATHIVFRLGDTPLRIYRDRDDILGQNVGTSLIGGARATPYIKDVSISAPSVGAVLRPGAIDVLADVSAIELAGRHTQLENLLPHSRLSSIIDQLRETSQICARLRIFEDFLSSRLPQVHAIHPLVAHALERFDARACVWDIVTETGFSQRHFTRTFTQWVGLAPKTYCRVRRFGRVLKQMDAILAPNLADLAAAEGYADQAHMTREFRALAGLTPAQYVTVSPAHRYHVPFGRL